MKNRNLNHSDNWATPKELYEELNTVYHFDFDPCPLNHDTNLWDGLKVEWGKSNFVNPPYSRKLKDAFVLKAVEESRKGKTCVLLLPVSTSTKLFHEVIKPNAAKVEFIKGRVKFKGVNTKGELVNNKAGMHDSMIVVFDSELKRINEFTLHQVQKDYKKLLKENDELREAVISKVVKHNYYPLS